MYVCMYLHMRAVLCVLAGIRNRKEACKCMPDCVCVCVCMCLSKCVVFAGVGVNCDGV